ncbi:MAG: O-antigen ligase family protein [Cardiobacteriaceae bacterium]|nr:O-antigen ligase family protein [Cardiobacteriaceae bacterium]
MERYKKILVTVQFLTIKNITNFAFFISFLLCWLLPSGYHYGLMILSIAGIYLMLQNNSLEIRNSHLNAFYHKYYFLLIIPLYLILWYFRDFGIIICSLFALCLLLTNYKTSRKFTSQNKFILAVVLYCLLESLFVQIPNYDIREYKNLRVIFLVGIFAFYLFLHYLPKIEVFINSITVFLLVSFVLVLYARLFLHIPVGKEFNHIIHHTIFSNLVLLFSACLFLLAEDVKNNLTKYSYYAIAALGLFAAFLSGARVSLLVLPVLLFWILLFSNSKNKRKILLLLAAIAAIYACYYGLFSLFELHRHSVLSDIVNYRQGNSLTSQGMRLEMYKCGLQIFADKPILGGYVDSDIYVYSAKGICSPLFLQIDFMHFHNEYIDRLARAGIIGLALQLAFLLLPLYFYSSIYRQNKANRYAQLGIILCFWAVVISLPDAMFYHKINLSFVTLLHCYLIANILRGLSKNSSF